MKAAAAQARDRWRRAPAKPAVGSEVDSCATSGTHAIGAAPSLGVSRPAPYIVAPSHQLLEQKSTDAERALVELQLERDELSSRLQGALAEIARLEDVVKSLPPPAALVLEASVEAVELLSAPVVVEPLSRVVVSTTLDEAGRQRTFEVEFLAETYFIAGFDQDMARGGVFAPTYGLLEVGTTVQLALEFGEHRIVAHGEVRWVLAENEDAAQRPGLAIFFSELPLETAAVLADYCRSYPPRYYEV